MIMEKKYAVITGGTRGIGAAITEKFLYEGYEVIATYVSNYEGAMAFKQNMIDKGFSPEIRRLDIREEKEVLKFFSEIEEKVGCLDILVNNGGVTDDNLITELSIDSWNNVINVNLAGTFLCSKYAIPMMKNSKDPTIINMSSINGKFGSVGQVNYSSSKAGIIGFTKSLSKELKRYGIRVNGMMPGLIKTDMTEKVSPRMIKRYLDSTSSCEIGKSSEVASLAYFLSTRKSRGINGQMIPICGGFHL
ncbi:SDR family oxidoreductase [Rossellomorea sp. LjRoot5]|uniref:SDR family oxidoreductase n=1 Tax=Rossellomorea sp. LjRoot5 TaxID=3342331 RepID=UPI003ECFD712